MCLRDLEYHWIFLNMYQARTFISLENTWLQRKENVSKDKIGGTFHIFPEAAVRRCS